MSSIRRCSLGRRRQGKVEVRRSEGGGKCRGGRVEFGRDDVEIDFDLVGERAVSASGEVCGATAAQVSGKRRCKCKRK